MPASTTARPGFLRRHWAIVTLLVLLLVPAGVFAAWAAVTLGFSYSDGNRVGYNQKLSRKGWLCKTWEGELALSNVPGQAPEMFRYSVRDDAVATQIQRLAGQRVELDYEQHRGVPTRCFGETEYYAVRVRPVAEPGVPGYGGAMPAPTTSRPAPSSNANRSSAERT